MGSFIMKSGATVLAAAALAAVPAAAYARPSAHKKITINVGCSHTALVAAVTTANALGTATIRLTSFCTYNFTAAAVTNDALPIITGDVTILGGPSTTIRRDPAIGTPAFRIFEVATGGTLRADGFFIVNGAPAAGVPGAGIENAGTLHLVNVTLDNNTTNAANGGGVDNTATGNAVISSTLLTDNIASTIGAGGGISNSGVLTLSSSRLSQNSATATATGGGGVANLTGATSTIIQSTLDHNTSTGNGGGVYNAGTASFLNTLVERNTATVSGGGIFNLAPGTVALSNSIIRLNIPNNCFPLGSIAGCVG